MTETSPSEDDRPGVAGWSIDGVIGLGLWFRVGDHSL
jgi:hypothetical protein